MPLHGPHKVYLIEKPGPSACSSHGRVKNRGKGHRPPSQTKYVIESVRKFFESEKRGQRSILQDRVVERTAKACGVGVRIVYRVESEFKSCEV